MQELWVLPQELHLLFAGDAAEVLLDLLKAKSPSACGQGPKILRDAPLEATAISHSLRRGGRRRGSSQTLTLSENLSLKRVNDRLICFGSFKLNRREAGEPSALRL